MAYGKFYEADHRSCRIPPRWEAATNISMNTMHPIRRRMALSEARKQTPQPLDTSGFATEILRFNQGGCRAEGIP